MQSSSIYSDLKRFSGPIRAIRINTDSVENDMYSTPSETIVEEPNTMIQTTQSRIRGRPKKSELLSDDTCVIDHVMTHVTENTKEIDKTIDEIANMIKSPLSILRTQAGEIIHDTATIAAKCDKGHIHKYYIKDIANGLSHCTTCKSGTKFTTLARGRIEEVVGMPFILAEKSPAGYLSYVNPILKITVNLGKSSGANVFEKLNDSITFTIHPTISIKKINDAIYTSLSEFPLPQAAQERITALAPKSKIAFVKAPLPYTSELAALTPKAQLNIVDEPHMRLEEC